MNTTHYLHPARRISCRVMPILAGLVLTAAACTGYHREDELDHDSGTGIPSGAAVVSLPRLPPPWHTLDRTDPAAVAIAAVQAVFDWRPWLGDLGPEDAVRRAAPLLSARAVDDYRPYPLPRPIWQTWMDTNTTITAATTITAEEHPTDTPAVWQRKTSTTLTITTPGHLPSTFTVTSLIALQKQPVWTVTFLAHLL